jgi:hypothetical protein
MTPDALKSLAGALAKAGAPILSGALTTAAGALGGPAGAWMGAGVSAVIGALADALGTAPTPEAVAAKVEADPAAATQAAQQVEASQGGVIAAIHAETARQLALAETNRESFFSWGWRPAMSWLLIGLWTWALFALPTLKATALPALQPIPMDNLLSFTGIWLTIYGGGHTLKAVLGKA